MAGTLGDERRRVLREMGQFLFGLYHCSLDARTQRLALQTAKNLRLLRKVFGSKEKCRQFPKTAQEVVA